MLNTPYILKHNRLNNKLVMAPAALNFDKANYITENEADQIIDCAKSCGLLIIGSHAVSKETLGISNGWVLSDDYNTVGLNKILAVSKSRKVPVILQLYDGDFKKNVPHSRYDYRSSIVNDLTEKQIYQKIRTFVEAAKIAMKLGLDGIEIHSGNSFLLQQFFSPYYNRRSDNWGGSNQKRKKFLFELLKALNYLRKEKSLPEFLIGLRILPEEFPGGIELQDTLNLIGGLSSNEIDYLHLSMKLWNQTDSNGKLIVKSISESLDPKITLINNGKLSYGELADLALEHSDLVSMASCLLEKNDFLNDIYIGNSKKAHQNSKMQLRNKTIMSPISTLSARKDGSISESEKYFYLSRAQHIDIAILGATGVSKEGSSIKRGHRLVSKENVNAFKSFNNLMNDLGCKTIIQVYHGGYCSNLKEDEKRALDNLIYDNTISRETLKLLEKVFNEFIKAFKSTAESGFIGYELNFQAPYLLDTLLKTSEKKLGIKIIKGLLKTLKNINEKLFGSSLIIGLRFSPSNYLIDLESREFLLLVISELSPYIDYLSLNFEDYRNSHNAAIIDLIRKTSNLDQILVSGHVRSQIDEKVLDRYKVIGMKCRPYLFEENGLNINSSSIKRKLSSRIEMKKLRLPDSLISTIENSKEWVSNSFN